MNIRQYKMTASRQGSRAFTLIELLVVVFIIGLLIAMLLPTVGVIIRNAQATKTKVWIASLATACETYKTQNQVYPGQDPFWTSQLAISRAYTGSQVLGITLLGPNGYIAAGNNVMPPTFKEPGLGGTYTHFWDTTTNPPNLPVVSQRKAGTNSPTDPGTFSTTVADKFTNPMPILYYPARLNSKGLAQFVMDDSKAYWSPVMGKAVLDPKSTDPTSTFRTLANFNMYITDPAFPTDPYPTFASNTPYNAGGFILVSAGIDRVYGNTAAWTTDPTAPTARFTCDDIKNYNDSRN